VPPLVARVRSQAFVAKLLTVEPRIRRSVVVLALVVAPLPAQVPYARLLRAEGDSANWLTYSGGYRSQRYSALGQVTTANVARLRPVWMHQLQNSQTDAETVPIVADGVMYVTEPYSAVTALDLRTGRPLWRWGQWYWCATRGRGPSGCAWPGILRPSTT
jgi:glucose dehydrogenase